MSVDQVADFGIECLGRNTIQEPVLQEPVNPIVYARQRDNSIHIDVHCEYNAGPHGNSCLASGTQATCPYSIDLPYALDSK